MPLPTLPQLLELSGWPASIPGATLFEPIDMSNDIPSDYSDPCQAIAGIDPPLYARVEPRSKGAEVDLDRIAPFFIDDEVLSAPPSLLTYVIALRNGPREQAYEEEVVCVSGIGLTINEIGAKHKHLMQRAAMIGLIDHRKPRVLFAGEFLIEPDRQWYANFCSGTFAKPLVESLSRDHKVPEKFIVDAWSRMLQAIMQSMGIPSVSICPECERAPCLPRFGRWASHTYEHLQELVRNGYDVRLFDRKEDCRKRQMYRMAHLTWQNQYKLYGSQPSFQQKFPEPIPPPEGQMLIGGRPVKRSLKKKKSS